MTSPIITCECGAKVRVPGDATNRAFRCPKCKAALAMPALALPAGQVVVSSQRLDAGESVVCPICQTAVAPKNRS